MKELIVQKNLTNYEFRFLELTNVIEIYKESKFMYLINLSTKKPNCNCPGSIYHKKCWHLGMVKFINQQESIKEPWALMTEEAGEMKYVHNKLSRLT